MTEATYLNNHFLIAMPSLDDPNFARSVTLICQHNDEGAMGITLSRKANLTVGDILDQMKYQGGSEHVRQTEVLLGGPVQTERGFVLHAGVHQYESTFKVSDEIAVTTSRDILKDLSEGAGPEAIVVAFGRQLEQEMRDNAWLALPAEHLAGTVVFDTPAEMRWQEAARLGGINLSRLSGIAGRA
jgi:putative transcriptional regulator